MWNYTLQTSFPKRTTKAALKEKALLKTAEPSPEAKAEKELFTSLFQHASVEIYILVDLKT